MTFSLNAYLEEHKEMERPDDPFSMRELTPHIKCMSGLELSVQVGMYMYCTPRDNNGPYIKVEVGFPTMTVVELLPYKEMESVVPVKEQLNDKIAKKLYWIYWRLKRKIIPLYTTHPKFYHMLLHWSIKIFRPTMNHPINSIYPYTPVEIVEKIVEDHGGLWTEERTGMEPALGQGDMIYTSSQEQDKGLYATVHDDSGSDR